MKRIFLSCSLAIINCYASTVIHRSKFAQARVGLAPPPPAEMIEPPMPTGDLDMVSVPSRRSNIDATPSPMTRCLARVSIANTLMLGNANNFILLISRKNISMVKYSRAKEILRNGAAL